MSFFVVIPARMASSRLPGKPLADIHGRPMIRHVWEQARASSALEVVIACDDARVAEVAAGFGAEVEMTSVEHPSGTDRIAEVAALRGWDDDTIVVNVQGDEPLLPPMVIDQVAANLAAHGAASVATLCETLESRRDVMNPNIVKVVRDDAGFALYFSRAPVPWSRDGFGDAGEALPEQGAWFRHIGIYAYRCGLLRRFTTWSPAELERVEMLEQLRIMARGERIHVAPSVAMVPGGVDTPEDLERIRAALA